MKPAALALLVVCGTMLVTAAAVPALAAEPMTEDIPVAGGLAALAALAEVTPVPDRARFVAEVARVIYSSPATGPYSNEPIRRRIGAFFADAGPGAAGSDDDAIVPVPLSAALWSQAVFHRQVDRRDLIGAILADRSASLLCYGLAALDDDTLQFLADHPTLLGRLAERAPAAFAAFGESLHIRSRRIVPPGGAAAQPLWEAAVGEKLDRPERFVQVLFENDRGRLAYLYDVLSHLDPPALAFALESSIGDPEERATRFKRLAALAKRAFAEWDVTTAPFVRPPNALGAFFARIQFDNSGNLAGPTAPAFWHRAFEDSGAPAASGQTAGGAVADAAWLTELVLGQTARERERRLEAFTFAQRVFGSQPVETGGTGQAGLVGAETDDVLQAVRAFVPFPVLMLTLERMGVRTPSIYTAGAQQAEKLTDLDQTRGSSALAQFQGALTLLSRLVRVHTIDAATGERLARDLFDARLIDGRFAGAIAAWMNDRLRPVLAVPAAANATSDEVLLAAAAGPRATGAANSVEWEGQRYQVDIGGAELQRLTRVREKQNGPSFELVLGVAAIARRLGEPSATLETARDAAAKLTSFASELAASSRAGAEKHDIVTIRDAVQTLAGIKRANDVRDARKAGAQLTAASDVMLGEALLSLAYALDLGDPEGTILIAGDPSTRHDFGYGLPGHDARVKAMWGIAVTETRSGPSHLVGSTLALDIAMAPLALRRIHTDRVPEAPMLNLIQRDGFAATVAVMDSRALTDGDRDEIASRIDRGRRRVVALTARDAGAPDDVDAIAREAGFDGWRRRALAWTVRHEPGRIGPLFTMAEFLVLGGGAPADFNPWGNYALRTRGCFCTALAAPGRWQSWWGLSQAGLPAGLVSDLPLYVAVVLHNLNLPAVLAKSVLAAAMQDFVDGVNPTDGNDWLTLARAAQTIDAERYEDYVAAATADGPLLPDLTDK